MSERRARIGSWRAVATVVALLLAAPVAAAERACSSLSVEADARVHSRWPELAARVREAFVGRADIDACARVWLGMRGGSLELVVALPDGRSATRVLERPGEIEPTLAALLLVPEPSAPAIDAEPEPREPEPVLPDVEAEPSPPRAKARRPYAQHATGPQDAPSEVRLDFSLLTAARAGDGMVSAGVGALSTLDLASWLIACELRLDGYSSLEPSEDLGPVLSLAALGGYRIRFGTMALDLSAGPALAMIASETTDRAEAVALPSPNGAPPPVGTAPTLPDDASSSAFVPRLAIAAHYRFAMHSLLRAFVGVDAQLGPSRLGDDSSAGMTRLPEWALGLVLGATLGMR